MLNTTNLLRTGLKDYSLECVTAAANQMNLTKMQAKAIFTAKELKDNELNQAIATATLASSQDKAARITKDLGTAFQGLKSKIKDTVTSIWTFITASPVGRIVGIASAVIAVTATIVTINKKIEEHRQKLKEAGAAAREENKSLKSDLDSFSSSANSALDSYTKLMNGVDTSNHTNLSLSEEEYADFISASNELADLFPELVGGLDKEGNRIVNLGNNAEDASAKINSLVEAYRNLVAEETEGNLSTVFKGLYEDTRETSKELKDYTSNLEFFDNMNYFITDLKGIADEAGGKTFSLSNTYLTGLDSQELMKQVADIVNSSLGTDLEVEYNDLTKEWFLDLTSLTEKNYRKAVQALYLNSDILKDKIVELMEPAISEAREEINKHYKQQLTSIFTALSDDIDYIALNDTERQLANALISGLDYSECRDEIKSKYKGNITSFLNEEILDALYNATDEDKRKINQAYANLLSIDPDASLSVIIQTH